MSEKDRVAISYINVGRMYAGDWYAPISDTKIAINMTTRKMTQALILLERVERQIKVGRRNVTLNTRLLRHVHPSMFLVDDYLRDRFNSVEYHIRCMQDKLREAEKALLTGNFDTLPCPDISVEKLISKKKGPGNRHT